MGRSGLAGTGTPHVADDVVELDDVPAPVGAPPAGASAPPDPPAPWSASLPAWARGPLGALVLALVVAVVSAGVTATHGRAVEREHLREQAARAAAEIAVLSLQPGAVEFETQSTPTAEGLTRVGVTLPLLNRGRQVLDVTVLGLTFAHQRTDEAPAPFTLDPGSLARVPFVLAVDCGQVPHPGAGSPPGTGGAVPAVVVRLASSPARPRGAADATSSTGTATAARTVRLPLLRQPFDDLAAGLRYACHPDPGDDISIAWDYPPDGHLRATVSHDGSAASQPVTVALQASAGLGAVSAPAFPLSLAPGTSVAVDVAVEPDCATVGDGSRSRLDLVLVDGGGVVERSLSEGRPASLGQVQQGTTAWLARRIALRCG